MQTSALHMIRHTSCYICIYLLSCTIFISGDTTPPPRFNLAAQVPLLVEDGEPVTSSLTIQQAILMAVNEINNKTDGVADDLLPQTHLYITIRSVGASFEDGVSATVEQVSAFGENETVVACIGPSNFETYKGGSSIFLNHHVAQVGYHARDSAVGMSDLYPNSLRTVPGHYVAGYIIADFVSHQRWKRVSLFSTSDTFGNIASFFFAKEARKHGVTILTQHKISKYTKDYSSHILRAKRSGAKIFVLLMSSESAAKLLSQAYLLGLFNSDTVIIGNEEISSLTTWARLNPELPSLVTGFISFKYHEHPELSKEKTEFIQRFRSQSHTLGRTENSSEVCDNSTDATGNYLYRVDYYEDHGSVSTCVGLNHSLFVEDGSDLHPAVYHAYDATYAIANGLHRLVYEKGNYLVNDDGLTEELLYGVHFPGVSGEVTFSTQYEEAGLDVGGRSTGFTFDILNYDSSFSSAEFVLIGKYHSETGVTFCENCRITYAGSEKKPLDRAEAKVVHLNSFKFAVAMAFSLMAVLFVIFYLLIFVVYKETRLIKAAQPLVCYTILFGCCLGCIRSIAATVNPTVGLCILQLWLSHMSFAIVFSGMLVKLWKVHKVMYSSFKRIKLSRIATVRLILLCTLPVCIYLFFISLLGGVEVIDVLVRENQHSIVYQQQCEFELRTELYGLYAIELMSVLCGLYLCYLVKDIPESLSHYIALSKSITCVTFLSSVCFFVIYSFQLDPNSAQCLVSVAFSLCIITILDYLFRSTCVNLLLGKDISNSFLVKKGMHKSVLEVWNGVPISPEEDENYCASPSTNIVNNWNLKTIPRDVVEVAERKKEIHNVMDALRQELSQLVASEIYSDSDYVSDMSVLSQAPRSRNSSPTVSVPSSLQTLYSLTSLFLPEWTQFFVFVSHGRPSGYVLVQGVLLLCLYLVVEINGATRSFSFIGMTASL